MHLDCLNIDRESSDSVSPRGLAVVDDYKLRKELFSTSAHLLKQIHHLEKVHANFLNFDQLLYQDWYNVTFRNELLAGEQLEKRLKTLSTFQVHLYHIARTSQVSLEEAYVTLKQEEAQYQNGDEAWRFVIDNLRKQRDENATKRPPPAATEEFNFKKSDDTLLQDAILSDESALSGLRRSARAIYHYLNEIDDTAMARHLGDYSAGFQLFKESFQIAMKCGDWKLLARIWKSGGSIFQDKLLKPMPTHLKDFLVQMFAENAQKNLTTVDPEVEIILRGSYRKLARLLHPDMHSSSPSSFAFQEWAEKKWQKVQATYAAHDHIGLKNLEVICLAELGQLNHLTLSEIYQSSLILAEQLEALKKNLKLCRKHPAWNFSSRRKYDALTVRVRGEIKARFALVESQVHALEAQLEDFI